jgi:hypothetical protein
VKLLTRWVFRIAFRTAAARCADVAIGGWSNPYMLRWYVIPRNRWLNVYLHYFLRSDDDRALHDHPWWSVSWLLEGVLIEHRILDGGIHARQRYEAGKMKLRSARYAHRIEVLPGCFAWTLFITGPVIRKWGFHCPGGWRAWSEMGERDGSGAALNIRRCEDFEKVK